MSDDTTTEVEPQAGDTTDPQAGTQEATPQAGDTPAVSTETPTAEDLQRQIAELRKENAARRTKLKEYEDKAEAERLAGLSELERAKQEAQTAAERAAKAEADAARLRKETAIRAAAIAAGFADPDDAVALAQGIEVDDAGQPTNADEVIQALAASKPHLVAPQSTRGTATSPTRSQQQPDLTDREKLSLYQSGQQRRAKFF